MVGRLLLLEDIMVVDDLIDTLASAGISLTEASKILPISRSTLHNWKSGVTRGDALRLNLVKGSVTLLRNALEHGRLPLPEDVPHNERVAMIRRIISDERKQKAWKADE